MRRIRIGSIILFVIAAGVFAGVRIFSFLTGDYSGPQITMDEDSITVTCDATEEDLLEGIHAEDSKDGDVTDSLIVETKSTFIETGRRMITVAAFDSDNHVTKASREVVYSDYRSPRFAMESSLKFPLNTEEIMEGITASDVLDGDITSKIKLSEEYTLDTTEPGEYPMELTVTNSAGDVATLPVTVEIYDQSDLAGCPEITLSKYVVYTKKGKELNLWDYVDGITLNGREYERGEDGVLRDPDADEEAENATIPQRDVDIDDDDVDYDTPGVYEVTYSMTTEAEDTGTVRLIVVVTKRGGK